MEFELIQMQLLKVGFGVTKLISAFGKRRLLKARARNIAKERNFMSHFFTPQQRGNLNGLTEHFMFLTDKNTH